MATDLLCFGTQMNFSGPVRGRARIDVPNWADTNMALQPYDLRINDARPIIDTLSLDREGFTAVRGTASQRGGEVLRLLRVKGIAPTLAYRDSRLLAE